MGFLNKKIADLVTENYVYASVLYRFGIQFYHHPHQTLAQTCRDKGLEVKSVIKSLQTISEDIPDLYIHHYPIDLIIRYLKHSHQVFLKKKLPYMAKLIADLDEKQYKEDRTLVKDLQILFPLFTNDFIHHIHEEEDTLFRYIQALLQANQDFSQLPQLYFLMEKYSIQYFALDHHTHDDEMLGIRELTNNYQVSPTLSLHLQVIFAELKNLEKDLLIHAKVEDEILFIKALQLEQQIKTKLAHCIKSN